MTTYSNKLTGYTLDDGTDFVADNYSGGYNCNLWAMYAYATHNATGDRVLLIVLPDDDMRAQIDSGDAELDAIDYSIIDEVIPQ